MRATIFANVQYDREGKLIDAWVECGPVPDEEKPEDPPPHDGGGPGPCDVQIPEGGDWKEVFYVLMGESDRADNQPRYGANQYDLKAVKTFEELIPANDGSISNEELIFGMIMMINVMQNRLNRYTEFGATEKTLAAIARAEGQFEGYSSGKGSLSWLPNTMNGDEGCERARAALSAINFKKEQGYNSFYGNLYYWKAVKQQIKDPGNLHNGWYFIRRRAGDEYRIANTDFGPRG